MSPSGTIEIHAAGVQVLPSKRRKIFFIVSRQNPQIRTFFYSSVFALTVKIPRRHKPSPRYFPFHPNPKNSEDWPPCRLAVPSQTVLRGYFFCPGFLRHRFDRSFCRIGKGSSRFIRGSFIRHRAGIIRIISYSSSEKSRITVR